MENILRYYQSSLQDIEQRDLPKDLRREALIIKDISEVNFKKFQEKWRASHYGNNTKENSEPIEIIIAPFFLYRDGKAYQRNKIKQVFPYWIPLTVKHDNSLNPPLDHLQHPWLIRSVLSPNESSQEETPTLAEIDKVDDVLSRFIFNQSNWEDYWESAKDFFKQVTGFFWEDYLCEGWKIESREIIILPAKRKGANCHVLSLYHKLRRQFPRFSPLLKNYLSFEKRRALIPDEKELLKLGDSHVGQMNSHFSLSKSQRLSLLLSEKLQEGETLAVNGPPGTGKTALLQSIFANKIVKSVFDAENNRSPYLLACSTNNKAISNILDVCGRLDQKEGLFERWLPEIHSFGTYLVPASYERKGTYLFAYRDHKSNSELCGWYADYVEKYSLETCQNYFRNKFQEYNPNLNLTEISEISQLLKNQLQNILEEMETFLARGRIYESLFQTDAGNIQVAEEKLENLKKNGQEVQAHYQSLQDFIDIVEKYFKEENVFLKLLSFIPYVRREREQSLEIIRQKYSEFHEISTHPIDSFRSRLLVHLKEQAEYVNKFKKDIQEGECSLLFYRDLMHRWSDIISQRDTSDKMSLSSEWDSSTLFERIHIFLDLNHRCRAFWLAAHYWESRWLLERANHPSVTKRSFESMAYLTPLFVSTFYSAPSFVKCFESKIDFDLLVIDEAGQVSPEVAIPTLSFSKKALIVGDTCQMEPVWGIHSQKIDRANMKRYHLISDEDQYKEIGRLGYACSTGSLMKMAQNLSIYQLPQNSKIQGTLLVEHRRCVDEIIHYCNHYVYQDLLVPKVGPLKSLSNLDSTFPAWGYCHVKSISENKGGSRQNPNEAAAIAAWIDRWKKKLLLEYKQDASDDLKDIVAIITPFRAQIPLIEECLKNRGMEGITVGTIHALQGAEKPIIIFSPVYGENESRGPHYFNSSYNMLNVAVSRAKKHFFVIGNMELFQPTSAQSPASSMASLLFSSPDNALDDAFIYEEDLGVSSLFCYGKVERIRDLQAHRTSLINSINKAKKRLLIASPFISIAALEADELEQHFQNAIKRGVEVTIYTDFTLDKGGENQPLKVHAQRGRELLKSAGVHLKIKKGIHNKSLAVDDEVLIEGSFNWLSATRNPHSSYYREEASLVVSGDGVDKMIDNFYKHMEELEAADLLVK